jgi:hypothetical protein
MRAILNSILFLPPAPETRIPVPDFWRILPLHGVVPRKLLISLYAGMKWRRHFPPPFTGEVSHEPLRRETE